MLPKVTVLEQLQLSVGLSRYQRRDDLSLQLLDQCNKQNNIHVLQCTGTFDCKFCARILLVISGGWEGGSYQGLIFWFSMSISHRGELLSI